MGMSGCTASRCSGRFHTSMNTFMAEGYRHKLKLQAKLGLESGSSDLSFRR